MRNPAPINHFPPTLFSPNRSPIYGEAHLFSRRGRSLKSKSKVRGGGGAWQDCSAAEARDRAVHRSLALGCGRNCFVGNGMRCRNSPQSSSKDEAPPKADASAPAARRAKRLRSRGFGIRDKSAPANCWTLR